LAATYSEIARGGHGGLSNGSIEGADKAEVFSHKFKSTNDILSSLVENKGRITSCLADVGSS
jgi:hypothetical protein